MLGLIWICTLCGFLIFSVIGCQTTTSSPQWQWQRAETGLPRHAINLTVAAHPTDPNIIWAGYYDSGGLAVTRDGGQTWVTGAAGLADNPIFDLLQPGYNEITITTVRLLPDARHDEFVWDDFQVRNIRLVQP